MKTTFGLSYWETWKSTDLRNHDSASLLHVYSHNACNPNNLSLACDITSQMTDMREKKIFDVSAKRGRGDLCHGIRNNHLFSTDCSWSQISINSIKCKLDFSWLVEVNVKILNKLQHTSTIYSDSVDLRQKWNSEIQSQRTQHQSPKTSLER